MWVATPRLWSAPSQGKGKERNWLPAFSTSALAQLDPHQLQLTMAEHQGLSQATYRNYYFFFFLLKELFWVSLCPLPWLDAPAKEQLSCARLELLLEAQADRVSKG